MSLPSGARLGPYEILSPLGAGGGAEIAGLKVSQVPSARHSG